MVKYTYMNRFSKDQISEFLNAFNHLDKKNQGYFPAQDLREMLLNIGYNPTDKLLETLTIAVDNGNGRINFDEFMEFISQFETDEKNTKEAKDAFNAFDFEGHGYIAARDIVEALMFVMDKAPESDKEGIIKHFKLEKNRKIYFQEFKEMVSAFKPLNP